MKFLSFFLPLSLATALAMPAAMAGPFDLTGEHENYVGAILGSRHLDPSTEEAEQLNDNTPGVTLGRRFQLEAEPLEAFIEGGVFLNSYEETSPILLVGMTARVADLRVGELRVGGFTGIGYYRELGQRLNDEYGLPYFKGFIPLAGLALVYRYDIHELRLTTVPGKDVSAITNLSYTLAF